MSAWLKYPDALDTLPGLYASKLPARDHTADAAELVRLAALFASLPANETAKHRDQLAQASGDLARAIGGLFDD